MKEDRTHPGVLALKAPDDPIALTDLQPRLAVVVQRQDPLDLLADRVDVASALQLAVDRPVRALAQQHPRVPREAVDGERQAHRAVPLRSAERPAEPELRRRLQREGPARRDLEVRHRREGMDR